MCWYNFGMDIEEFVKDVLSQVTRSVNDNTSGGRTKYYVDSGGVSFDLAVTTASKESKTQGISGGMKVKVIGAEGNKAKSTEETKEQSSRVQFKVNVYTPPEDDGVDTAGSYVSFD